MATLTESLRLRLASLSSLLIVLGCCVLPTNSRADAGWFTAGDTQLRLDLQLLNDAEVIELPVSYWPLPRAAVEYALTRARDHFAANAAVAAALARVRAGINRPAERVVDLEASVVGGDAGLWRDFDTLGRENGEFAAGLAYSSGRVSAGIDLTAIANPQDGQALRLDGSHATGEIGNWLLSVNLLDRWWGPGHEGSLILSNNARPMPTFMVERAEARQFESRWLSWLGPWRMSFGISQMERSRQDIDSPLFMAWRVVIMPTKKMEIGFSRTAQFCGKELECSPKIFGNLLIGNDNVGIDTTAAQEPGNQMAGFDLRWNSPLGNLPYALYGQYIGEDESGYLPAKFLSQLGMEVWHPYPTGGMLQGFFEYASTTCSANTTRGPYYLCAYNQGRFNVEGYRYHGRSVGYTADRDAENWAAGGIYSAMNGSVWTATARISRLDRATIGDWRNTVASVPTDYEAIEFGWKGLIQGLPLSVDLGVQSVEPLNSQRDIQLFGFIGWRHEFRP
jgi:hypothetical protein